MTTMKFGTRRPSFAARRPGTCPRCGFIYHEGELIKFAEQHERPVHVDCPAEAGSVNTTNPTVEGSQ